MNHTNINKEYVDKILNSEEFATSNINQTFLAYLIDAKNQGKNLKESTIAIEFFGKSADFNPAEDAIVRSHIYNLRKKLETYYLKEGKDDKYRVKIPKGHYEISFDKATTDDLTFKSKYEKLAQHKVSVIITLFLCVLLVVIGISNFTLNSELQKYRVINEFDPIWKDYLKSNLPILIVIGDHFFFNEYNETYQNLLAIRDGKINSFEDLEKLITLHPEKDLRPADEPYFPYHSIWSLPPILSILYSANQKPVLRRSSSIGPQLLNEYNIIFVGSIKTLYILKYTLSKSHFEFEISPHVVKYSMPDTNATQVFNTNLHSAGPNEDLVLTLKLPGPANNSIFIIASYHSLGAPEIANYLTNPTTRQDLENKFQEKYGKIPNYFELLFRVIGIDKTAYSTELLIYNEIIKENEPGALD